MKYDVKKVRAACLELMGWEYDEDAMLGCWRPPEGRHGAPVPEGLVHEYPDPTTSLDAALPLIEKYGIALMPPRGPVAEWGAQLISEVETEYTRGDAPTAPLAVCLCALRCAGRDLKDFEATP